MRLARLRGVRVLRGFVLTGQVRLDVLRAPTLAGEPPVAHVLANARDQPEGLTVRRQSFALVVSALDSRKTCVRAGMMTNFQPLASSGRPVFR